MLYVVCVHHSANIFLVEIQSVSQKNACHTKIYTYNPYDSRIYSKFSYGWNYFSHSNFLLIIIITFYISIPRAIPWSIHECEYICIPRECFVFVWRCCKFMLQLLHICSYFCFCFSISMNHLSYSWEYLSANLLNFCSSLCIFFISFFVASGTHPFLLCS